MLIQRYLKLLAEESVEQPEQVLAITFTVKATNEMRERVMVQLQRASESNAPTRDSEFNRETHRFAQAVLDRDALLGWRLLEHPHRLRIRTIDSVCAEIAQSLPVLSGGGGACPSIYIVSLQLSPSIGLYIEKLTWLMPGIAANVSCNWR